MSSWFVIGGYVLLWWFAPEVAIAVSVALLLVHTGWLWGRYLAKRDG